MGGIALDMGFSEVASGPFVRSSYHAEELHRGLLARSEVIDENKEFPKQLN